VGAGREATPSTRTAADALALAGGGVALIAALGNMAILGMYREAWWTLPQGPGAQPRQRLGDVLKNAGALRALAAVTGW
jgi:hypothetical protein